MKQEKGFVFTFEDEPLKNIKTAGNHPRRGKDPPLPFP